MADSEFVEHFAALDAVKGCRSGFIGRIPGIDGSLDKAEALRRLETAHRRIRQELGVVDYPLVTAQQVHGANIAVVEARPSTDQVFEACDGIITNQREVMLGIYVADCCAVYLVDPVTPAIGLVHSGKKGTEQNIVGSAIEHMITAFGSRSSDMVVQLSPCIRPPRYEIDFAATIREQCRQHGVSSVHDNGACTGADLTKYYSYRMEKGKTGRMLALLALR